MIEKKFGNYAYEDDYLIFKSHIDKFDSKYFKKYDSNSKNLNLKLKIEDLMDGKVVNNSENQGAWHPKYRKEGPKLNNILQNRIDQLKKNNPKKNINILVIGIGGSFEGPKLLIESLKLPSLGIEYNIEFITGSDESEFKCKTELLDPKKTIFIAASKSFLTDETINILKSAKNWSLNNENFIAITSNITEAKKYGFKEKNIITFDKEIGGRYSIWSPIASVPILDKAYYNLFVKGGREADIKLLNDEEYLNFIKRLSYSDIWQHNNNNKSIRVVLSYIWAYRSLPDYFQQLEMESLGKQPNFQSGYKKTSQIILGGYGPTAQHSYFQLLHQGTQNICADIISTNEDLKSLAYVQAITQAQLLSIGAKDLNEKEKINGNVPINLFLLKKINPFTLGYLIATWEHRTYVTAMLLGINPFDQFGVMAGKIYTKKNKK